MTDKEKIIGLLLFGGPESQNCSTVAGLAEAALKRGISVEIFMMYEAVHNGINKRFEELAEKGAKVTVCGHNADELNAVRSEKFKYGSQFDNANLLADSARYLAFL